MTKSSSKSKAKRWKKGHSSSSNPETKKHRDAAKGRFFHTQKSSTSSGPSQLTVSALSKHDADQLDMPEQQDDAATFKTWATNYTECTNKTFSKVHHSWQNDAIHKEVLAVLAAVTEIIKTQGGQETEVEYFAILMTTVESTDDPTVLSATIYLLSLVLKQLPRNILQAKFGEISKVLMSLVEKHAEKEGSALISKLVTCLTTVLRAQDAATWTQSSTQSIYLSLLMFACYSKPKVRKAVREAVVIVIRGSEIIRDGTVEIHPAASVTENYCTEQVQKLLNNSLIQKSKELTWIFSELSFHCKSSNEIAQCSDIIHLLQLMKEVISCFPRANIKSSCEMVLRLMSLNNMVLKGVCMEIMNSLFYTQPPADRLSAELNAKIITAMYDFLPNVNDIQMMPAWLLVVENAHINLVRNDSDLCLSHLPRLVSTCLKGLLSERAETMTAAAVTLKSTIISCLGAMDKEFLKTRSTQSSGALVKVLQSLQSMLGYQYHACWSLALQVLATLIEVLADSCPQPLTNMLPAIADLRDNPEFTYKAELDRSIGSAIRYLGPRALMSLIPLQFSVSGENIKRSWLMPLLTTYISHTEIAFFTQYFLPLAAKCRDMAQKQETAGNIIQQKVQEALVHQIWALLPSFCNKPTDLAQSFKNLAKTIGQAIADRPDLRKYCLAGLRKLVHSAEDNHEFTAELSKYSKNYMPILFNVYTSDDLEGAGDHQVVLDTVRDYLKVTDQKMVNSFYDKCMGKLTEAEPEEELPVPRRNAIMDLAISMVLYVDTERITQVCQYVAPLLEGTDKTLQKKAYRFLDNICSMKTSTCTEFVSENIEQLQTVLLKNLASSNSSSKGPRLRCLINIFKMLEADSRDFLIAVLPEAILCTREVGETARKSAYELIVAMCEANIGWKSECEISESVMDYLSLMVAGLAGSPQMIHSTVLAITRIIYEYKKEITSDNLVIIMEHSCALLKSKSKEVVIPALSLLKVIIGSFDVTTLARYLQPLCQAISHMKEDSRHHLRFKVKEILERLVRKFGYETVIKLIPQSLHKQLANIRKTQERKKRESASGKQKRSGKSEDEDDVLLSNVKKSQPDSINELLADSDSELEDDSKTERQHKQAKQKKSSVPAWLKEDSDDITDFLDSKAAKNIIASRPSVRNAEKSKQLSDDFKTAADGRMVITELEQDKPQVSSKDNGQAELEDIDDIFEQFEMQAGKKPKKRRFESMADSASQITTSTYKTGGRGIHRSLNTKRSKTDTASNAGSEYKSKKAGGDVKRKNKVDPYAYVPLNVNNLNRRKSAKLKGQYKNLIGGAQKGAAKGKKGLKMKSGRK